jgi:hypothetical protein
VTMGVNYKYSYNLSGDKQTAFPDHAYFCFLS